MLQRPLVPSVLSTHLASVLWEEQRKLHSSLCAASEYKPMLPSTVTLIRPEFWPILGSQLDFRDAQTCGIHDNRARRAEAGSQGHTGSTGKGTGIRTRSASSKLLRGPHRRGHSSK